MNFISKFKKNSILKTGVNYSIVSTLKSIATMIVGILIMRWLAPEELGLWNAVSIFLAYIPFFHFGIQSALNLELPILLGQGENEKAEILVKSSKGFAFLVSIVFLIIGFVLTIILFFLNKEFSFILGILTISIMAASQSIQLHLIATFRSAKAFDKLTKIYLIDVFLILALVFFIYKFHYYGILIYNAVNIIAIVLLMHYYSPYKGLKPQLKLKDILNLAKTGLVLMSFIQIRTAAQSIPRWLILSFGGIIKLGLFSPAIAINGLMNMFPSQISQFFHPQMGYKYGQTKNARDMWKYIKLMVIIFPLASLPVCVLIWGLSPWLLETFFPKYIESEWAMKIMSVGFVFSSATTTHGVLYTIKAYKIAYVYSFIELSGYFLLPFLFAIFSSFDILTSITLGLAINNFILYFLNIYIVRRTIFLPKYNNT